ncbi:hypothetical protein LINGRAHAP2_LOCUS6080 [Linum grandiflorum]
MEDQAGLVINDVNKLEDDEEEFRSCCGDDADDEISKEEGVDGLSVVKMYFKGVSITEAGESGIGVVMERKGEVVYQVQKKLDFYVDSSVADYLALMEGLIEAVKKNDISHVYAYTDSSLLYNQITLGEKLEIPLISALRERIMELGGDLETFSLKLVPSCDLERPLRLALIAVGIVSFPADGHDNCSMCRQDKMSPMMITIKCCHKFCSHCMRTYVEDKLLSSQVPIRCPEPGCKYYISVSEGQSFLTHASYEPFMKAQSEARICCQQCRGMIELTQDCCHMTCWCSNELCYSCGSEYRDGQQSCQCGLWEEDNNTDDSVTRSVQVSEQWAWETFNTMPILTDAYSDQERSQLALIQRFLSGGFSLSDHDHPPDSPPRCTVDIMKDLQPFPWLERFMSVISDDYNDYSSFSER